MVSVGVLGSFSVGTLIPFLMVAKRSFVDGEGIRGSSWSTCMGVSGRVPLTLK